MISIYVAYANNGVIGRENALPWYIPDDLKRLKRLTVGHSVIMGRKTFDSIIKRIGKPLPERRNIVLTREAGYSYKGVEIVTSLDDALTSVDSDDESFIMGGAEIYRLFFPLANRIYATEVDADIDGDVYFPGFDHSEWKEVERLEQKADEKNPYNYAFVKYERLK